MRKLIVLFLLTALGITLSHSLAFSASYPSPAGYVNDFADVIPPDVQERIEAKISEYEKQTSIEIAVVTTKSLDGMSVDDWTIGLATQWGVGKKGKDNGLVFAIAPNERKMRIEVGYGLEGEMNDAKAGRILDDYAVPYFKQGDYATGIEKTTEAIMNAFGRISLQERNEAKAQRLEQEQEKAAMEAKERIIQAARAKERLHTFMAGLLVLAVIAGIFFSIFFLVKAITKAIKENNRKKALRKSIMRDISEIRENTERLEKRINEATKKAASFPQWAFSIADSNLKSASSILLGIERTYDLREQDIKKEPDRANQILDSIKKNISKVEQAIGSVEVDIPKEIKEYEESASKEIAQTANLLAKANRELKDAKSQGLFSRDNSFDKSLEEAEKSIKENRRCLLSDKNKAREVCNSIASANEKISAALDEVRTVIETRKATEIMLQALPGKVDIIEKEEEGHKEILEGMRKSYPEDNWKDILGSFMLVAGLITLSKNLIDSAGKNNSVEQQKFYDANSEALKAKEHLEKAESIFNSIAERKRELEQARQSYATELSKAELKVKDAVEKAGHSDVSESAENKAKDAEAKLKEAKRIIGLGGMINWLSVILLISTAIKLAAEAETNAQSDIDAAKGRRRRKREEEERKRIAAALASASRHSSSSSHSRGFGGFGGGGFGGGGARRSF